MPVHIVSDEFLQEGIKNTNGIITHADGACNVGERPQAALREVDALLFEVLKFLYQD